MKKPFLKINIDITKLRFGIYLGFKLSRLEWIWDAEFDECKEAFIPSKKEILSLVPKEEIFIDETNYKIFSQSILNYYFRTDTDIYYSILIGFAIQRCHLVGASSDENENLEVAKLARSALISIPNEIISNKDSLFDMIMNEKNNELFEIIEVLESFCQGNLLKENQKFKDTKTLFLSYCSNDIQIAQLVESKLKETTGDLIEISKYNDVVYKQSFKEFMNSIQDHDYVLCIVTDNYLKSPACMYEVGEIVKDKKFHKKLHFIVLQECDRKYYCEHSEKFIPANIFGDEKNRLYYIDYWQKQYEELKATISKKYGAEVAINARIKLLEIEKIYKNDIDTFLHYLSDRRCESLDKMYSNNFSSIASQLFIKNK